MADVSAFLDMMPPLEKGDPRITAVLWDAGMTKACQGVLENPAANVTAIMEKFADTDEGKDYRARYLLRGVVTVAGASVAGGLDQKDKLEAVVGAIAAGLSSTRNKEVKAAYLRELKFCGTASAAKAIAPFLTDEQLYADAALALRNIKTGATALLVAAFPNATGKAKTEIVHALAALGEAEGLPVLKTALTDKEQDTRLAAAWGLARLGDAGSADAMLKAAAAAKDWDRFQLTSSCLVLGETLKAAGKKAEAAAIYTSLKTTRTEPADAYVVKAANIGLKD